MHFLLSQINLLYRLVLKEKYCRTSPAPKGKVGNYILFLTNKRNEAGTEGRNLRDELTMSDYDFWTMAASMAFA